LLKWNFPIKAVYPVRKKASPFGRGKKCAAQVGSKAPNELSNGVYFMKVEVDIVNGLRSKKAV